MPKLVTCKKQNSQSDNWKRKSEIVNKELSKYKRNQTRGLWYKYIWWTVKYLLHWHIEKIDASSIRILCTVDFCASLTQTVGTNYISFKNCCGSQWRCSTHYIPFYKINNNKFVKQMCLLMANFLFSYFLDFLFFGRYFDLRSQVNEQQLKT